MYILLLLRIVFYKFQSRSSLLFNIPFVSPFSLNFASDKHSFQKNGFFFFLPMQHVGSYFSDWGSNLCLLQWKYRVLATGLPGEYSKELSLSKLLRLTYWQLPKTQSKGSCYPVWPSLQPTPPPHIPESEHHLFYLAALVRTTWTEGIPDSTHSYFVQCPLWLALCRVLTELL